MHVGVNKSRTNSTSSDDAATTGFLPPIVDIWSAPLNPIKGLMDSGPRVERRFTALSERPLSLLEDTGDSIARHLWDGSQALASHLDALISLAAPAAPLPLLEHLIVSATYRRLHVLELGCGVGTVGISLAQSVPDIEVVLTDLEEVRELVEANVRRMKAAMSSRVRFEALDWEEPVPSVITARTTDLILVSECTYNTSTLPALVSTLTTLTTRSPKALIVVATKRRHESELDFFDLMQNAGFIEDGRTQIPLPGLAGTGYADTASEVGVYVFRGREHRLSLSPRGSEEEVTTIGASGGGRGRSGRGRA